jgi:ribonuclease BN (tRNA processing enzyme)
VTRDGRSPVEGGPAAGDDGDARPAGRLSLTVVGAAAAWARGPGRPSSCYLVELEGEAIVLDLGQGALGALFAWRDPASVRAIAISHLHPDHHVDLVALRHLLRYGMSPPHRLALLAPGQIAARYDAFLGEPGFLEESFDVVPVTEGTRRLGPFLLEARPVRHALASHGYRVSPAASPGAPGLVYSGDCADWRDLVPLVRPGDTLLSEAFWGTETPDPGAAHLTADEAARAAVDGGAWRLVLTHIGAEHDPDAALAAARVRFPRAVLLAQPGLRLPID